jgi:lipopolysaccharide export system protein LptA
MCYFLASRSRLRLIQIILTGIIIAIAIITTPKYLDAQNLPETGSITIRSDTQEANSETGIITASGNVQINYPARQIQATAAQAQYYSRERRLVLNGNVYVIQAGNSMRAESMIYLIDEARFIATPQSDRQVESTYIVNDPVPPEEEQN